MRNLVSWTAVAEPQVKHFSGTATHSKDVEAPESRFRPGRRHSLDLGVVPDIAEVKANGKSVGMAWMPLYQVDVTGALRSG
jgi:hypothetical protein